MDLATEHFHDQDRNIHRIALRANEFERSEQARQLSADLDRGPAVLGKNVYLGPTQRYWILIGVTKSFDAQPSQAPQGTEHNASSASATTTLVFVNFISIAANAYRVP